MPFLKGKFVRTGVKPPASRVAKPDAGARPVKDHALGKEGKDPQAAQGSHSGEKHVEVTHPGATQPHPVTGVHAVMNMHKGGGKYESHTHHDGGDVETKQHDSAEDMQASNDESIPPVNEGTDDHDNALDGTAFSDSLSGIDQAGGEGV